MRPAPKPSEEHLRAKRALERKKRRAQYAAMAMQGMLSSKWYTDFCHYGGDGRMSRPESLAAYAAQHADALLAELERET